MWYDYTDLIAVVFCLQSIYYWFKLYSQQGQFNLPITDFAELDYWIGHSILIQNYLNASSVAVIFLCIKNLRILTMYFPAFGVLFDTIRKAKTDLFFFFIVNSKFEIVLDVRSLPLRFHVQWPFALRRSSSKLQYPG